MKKYCETVSGVVFDWNKFLDDAIQNGVKQIDYENACNLSVNWVTCACGQQCSIIPRSLVGMPENRSLMFLGSRFNCLIENKDYLKAKKILQQIEQISIELINEIESLKK